MVERGMCVSVLVWVCAVVAGLCAAGGAGAVEPQVIRLDFSLDADGRGGVLAADLDGDGRMHFVVTAPGHIGAYRLDGKRLWHIREDVRVSSGSSERVGLPGHHAPGVQVADVDGDGRAELLYLDESSTVHICDASSGRGERAVRVPHPKGTERWEHLVVVNLRGKGDVDLVLQTTPARGYRTGHYVAACGLMRHNRKAAGSSGASRHSSTNWRKPDPRVTIRKCGRSSNCFATWRPTAVRAPRRSAIENAGRRKRNLKTWSRPTSKPGSRAICRNSARFCNDWWSCTSGRAMRSRQANYKNNWGDSIRRTASGTIGKFLLTYTRPPTTSRAVAGLLTVPRDPTEDI